MIKRHKITKSSLLSCTTHGSMTDNQHDEEKTQMRKTPHVLLIGTSNTSQIDPDKLCTKFNTDKEIAYNFEETISSIENASQDHYDIICLHSLTNEIKDKPVDQCVLEYDNIVQKCNERWPEAKIVLSLVTPRKDQFNNKIHVANAIVKEKYFNDERIHLCDHSNMSYRGSPQSKFLKNGDDVHLSEAGVKQFAANLKSSILSCLGISLPFKRTATQKQGNRNRREPPKLGRPYRNGQRKRGPQNGH